MREAKRGELDIVRQGKICEKLTTLFFRLTRRNHEVAAKQNVGITGVTARLFNAVRQNSEELATISVAKKGKSKFILSALEDYIFGPDVPDYDIDHQLYLGGEGMVGTANEIWGPSYELNDQFRGAVYQQLWKSEKAN